MRAAWGDRRGLQRHQEECAIASEIPGVSGSSSPRGGAVMERTKAAATVHSQVLWPLSRHSSLHLTTRYAGLQPQKEQLEKQEFPPPTISPLAREQGLP